MATEILSVPEEHLAQVIAVLRAGMQALPTLDEGVRRELTRWCNGEEAYLWSRKTTTRPA